jgi:hypothetical protein
MEVHIQKCHFCRSTEMCNLLVREPGQPQNVYVKCRACGEFVARYRLSEYYHNGKGIDSWLRSLGSAAPENGRDFLGEFERVKQAARFGFETANAQLETGQLR